MKLCGLLAVTEAANFLLIGKMEEPYIGDYINHVSQYPNPKTAKHDIVPDIHAIDYPTDRPVVNDSGAKSAAEAFSFFELRPSLPAIHSTTSTNSQYNFNNTETNPGDHSDKSVVSEYKSRFQNLDNHYAPDVVGDGNGEITRPFESAQNQLYCGQVVPLCAIEFGEVKHRTGDAIPIMHSQFRPAFGVAIARGWDWNSLSTMVTTS
eukprot:scaffold123770_cov71-Cyclotella_meneghiniana.AAC.13